MNFLADEGIDAPIVHAMRKEGYKVLYIAELEPRAGDDAILEKARNEELILITQDKDFGELVFRLEMTHTGVILIRLHGLSLESKIDIVLKALKKAGSEIINSFVVIQPGAVRMRKKGEF